MTREIHRPMDLQDAVVANVKQAVPFFNVTDIEASIRFYVDGLGFKITHDWMPEGRIRWCWLELGGAAVMLQEYWKDGKPGGGPAGPLGQGVSICSCAPTQLRFTTTRLPVGLRRRDHLWQQLVGHIS